MRSAPSVVARRPAVLAPTLTLTLALALAGAAPPPVHAADWLEFNLDGRHNGNNQEEIVINSGNVSTLHTLYHVTLPSVADGAPAFLSGVNTASGIIDMLFLNTKDGHILALNAATGVTVWSHQPATGPNYTTSSPAIDPNRQFVYAYALDGHVYKYQVADGTAVTGGGWPQLTTLKPQVEKGSGALSLAVVNDGTEWLYMNNGGYPGDAGDYQGHITAINLATGAQGVFNTQCSDQTVHFTTGSSPDCGFVQSAVWARAGTVYSTETNRLLFVTGNSGYDGNTGGHEWGDSILVTNPDGTGSGGLPIDAYTPPEFANLNTRDLDLGSTAPALLPAVAGSNVAHLAVQSGKDAQVRLVNVADLSGSGGPGHTGGELQKIAVPQGGQILTQPAVWVNPADNGVWVFLANNSGISAFQATANGAGTPSLTLKWMNGTGGTSPVLANGILYYASSGGVKALDPVAGTQLFSDSSIGNLHWESLIVVSGRLYITDESSNLWAYAPAAAPLKFFVLPPCRIVDTRGAAGTYGGPMLQGSGSRRAFPVTGQCGVPADAKAVAANVTAVSPSTSGDFRVGPEGIAAVTSTVSFNAGQIRASNVVVALTGNPLGSAWVEYDGAGSSHLLIDVSGYFK